jgi:hypothetical protein
MFCNQAAMDIRVMFLPVEAGDEKTPGRKPSGRLSVM